MQTSRLDDLVQNIHRIHDRRLSMGNADYKAVGKFYDSTRDLEHIDDLANSNYMTMVLGPEQSLRSGSPVGVEILSNNKNEIDSTYRTAQQFARDYAAFTASPEVMRIRDYASSGVLGRRLQYSEPDAIGAKTMPPTTGMQVMSAPGGPRVVLGNSTAGGYRQFYSRAAASLRERSGNSDITTKHVQMAYVTHELMHSHLGVMDERAADLYTERAYTAMAEEAEAEGQISRAADYRIVADIARQHGEFVDRIGSEEYSRLGQEGAREASLLESPLEFVAEIMSAGEHMAVDAARNILEKDFTMYLKRNSGALIGIPSQYRARQSQQKSLQD